MISINIKYLRLITLLCFAAIAVIGTIDLGNRKDFGIETEQINGKIVISSVAFRSNAKVAGIQSGDRLLSIGDRTIPNQAVAKWIIKCVRTSAPVTFRVERSGTILQIAVTADQQFPLVFIVLNTLLGLVFLAVGMMVWWSGNRDPTVRSFFRLNSVTGIAILLYGHENTFQLSLLHHSYSFVWLLTYCLIPATLVEFLLRFAAQNKSKDTRFLWYRLLYLPIIAIFVGLIFTYHKAYASDDPSWITRYDALFYIGFNSLLLTYFIAGLLILGYNYLRPINQAEKDRVSWLLICTVVGLVPFFILYKAPTLIGLEPFIPVWATFGLMLIVPIGWGMSVASFRMFKTEWVLSRTVIYAITVGVILYLMLTSTLISINYITSHDTASLVVLIAVGVIIIFLAVSGLIDQIRGVIDRLYYRDWYSYQNAVQDLGAELSSSVDDKTIIHILTERLTTILKIDKSTLIIKWQDETWRVPEQTTPLDGGKIEVICGDISRRIPLSVIQCDREKLSVASANIEKLGYQVMLPLIHAENIIGILLLGRKLSGAPFSMRDYLLLDTLSSTAGTALANLSLTRKLLDNEKRAVAVDMAAGVAHEINNALSPLMGQAQLIERSVAKLSSGEERDTFHHRINIVVEMCQRIKRIALNLSKISEPLRLEMSQVSLNSIIEETLQILTETTGRIKHFRTDDSEAKFQLLKELDPNLPLIQGDRQQLSQVFINLIINASDAMESLGEGTLTIGTKVSQDQSSVVGYVADTGIGISQQLLDKVFQPYFTTKAEGRGTGLGLPIVRSIIEAHGGHLTINSVEDKGTLVEFSLPISKSQTQ